ncbi:MAG: cohesin domain-containing protein [Candidatus Polarisedimenticolia bacterium]
MTLALVATGVIAQIAAMAPSATGSGRPGSISRGGVDAPGRPARARASLAPPAPHRALVKGTSSATSGRVPQAGWTVRPVDLGLAAAPAVVHADGVPAPGRRAAHRPETADGPAPAVALEPTRMTGGIPAQARPMAHRQVTVMASSAPAAVPTPAPAPAPAPVQPPSHVPAPRASEGNQTIDPPDSGMTPEPSAQGAQLVVVGPASVNADDVVEFAIVVQNAVGVAHAPLRLSFDPQVLEFVEAAEGDLLASDGGATRFQASEAGAPGLVDIALSRVRAGNGIHGSGTLCTVTFRARAAGMSSIVTTGSRLLDGSSRPLAFRRNDSHVAVE